MKAEHVWEFNNAVSLLNEARNYVPQNSDLGTEIKTLMPGIVAALREAAKEVTGG